METRKVVAFFLVLSMTLAALTACAPAPAQPTTAPAQPATSAPAQATTAPAQPSSAAPSIASKVIVAIGADPSDLSPFVGMSMGRIAVLRTTYEYLFGVTKMGGELVPFVAKGVEKTGDKTYVVTLFDNVADSAGNKITAADAAWSYNTGMAAGNLRPLGDIESVTATGDYTVQFVFKKVLGIGELEKLLTECPIVSRASYEASPDQFATKPITSSPYVLKEYVPGSSLTFERRAEYWQKDASLSPELSRANVQTIVFQIITEPAQHSIALETGSAHISASVTGDDIARFRSAAGFSVFGFQDNLTQLLAFNGSEGHAFTKKELRQAVAYAIDTTAMCNAVAPGACAATHTIGNSNFGGYQAKWDTEPYYDYDLAKAQGLLAAAGYKPGDLTVKLLAQNDPKSGLMAQVIQSQLKELGIKVEISQVEPTVYNQLKPDPKAYDLLIDAAAGGDFIINPWKLVYDQTRNNGKTSNFFLDNQLQELLDAASQLSGFTPEKLDAFQQYQKEQVYAYGMLSYFNNVVGVAGITKVVRDGRGQIIPGACEYAPDFK